MKDTITISTTGEVLSIRMALMQTISHMALLYSCSEGIEDTYLISEAIGALSHADSKMKALCNDPVIETQLQYLKKAYGL